MSTQSDNNNKILHDHSNAIIYQLNKINTLEKIVSELQNEVYKLCDKVEELCSKPTLKRKLEPDSESDTEPELDPEPDLAPKQKKTKLSSLTEKYIEKLISGKSNSNAWKPGMSKYTSISYNNKLNKWFWISTIFDSNLTYFTSKNDAEKHYEEILNKYNIPLKYIIRRGYDESKDNSKYIYIEKLKNDKSKTKAWKPGESKYTSIYYLNKENKWYWISQIFDNNDKKIKYFNTKSEAEKYYEKILAEHNIPLEYIIRNEYDESQDIHEEDFFPE